LVDNNRQVTNQIKSSRHIAHTGLRCDFCEIGLYKLNRLHWLNILENAIFGKKNNF